MSTTSDPAVSADSGDVVPPPGAPSGRRRRPWFLALAVLIVWLAIGGIAGPYQGKLGEVQKTDASSFLPSYAESTKAQALQEKFASSRSFPAIVLMESDKPLTAAQLSALRTFAEGIPQLSIPVAKHDPVKVGDFMLPGPVAVVPSADGKAAFAAVNFAVSKLGTALADDKPALQRAIEVIRAGDASLATDGARLYVAGPAGIIADLVKVFGGIDGVLLVVALITVLLILLVVYRSPFVPIFVLLSSVVALTLATFVVYELADNDVISIDGQARGIMSILVVGAATDYALLIVARYREELRRHDDRFAAMRLALRRAAEPILASAGTVILGLLCLLAADIGPTAGLGPVGAVGVAASAATALTFLPALLLIFGRTSAGEHGRWIFWPRVPHAGTDHPEFSGLWGRVSRTVGRAPGRVALISGLGLLVLCAALPTLKADGVTQSQAFLSTTESVTGGDQLSAHFPGGSGNPTLVIGPADKQVQIVDLVQTYPGVASVVPVTETPAFPGNASALTRASSDALGHGAPPLLTPKVVDGKVSLQVTLADPADSTAAAKTVEGLRTALDAVSPDALVGGSTAVTVDQRAISARDRNVVIPMVLAVILLVLIVLLRSLVAPLVLLAANVLSFAATLGGSALVFNHVFDFPGADTSLPLYGFIFLVALGIDYSIFLMTRVREESARLGTRPGILTGLAVTGGVITSAGVVLASTFAGLAALPLLQLAQVGFVVAFGVLLDTLVVRSLLVPSLSYLLGARTWWPGPLSRAAQPTDPAAPAGPADPAAESAVPVS